MPILYWVLLRSGFVSARCYGLDIPFWHSFTPLLYYTYLFTWLGFSYLSRLLYRPQNCLDAQAFFALVQLSSLHLKTENTSWLSKLPEWLRFTYVLRRVFDSPLGKPVPSLQLLQYYLQDSSIKL